VRVLVVDDEPNLRYLLRLLFEVHGHEVDEAGDGEAAIAQIGVRQPDVIVTDVMMPVMTGRELIARLRGDPATAEIPIIVVSASTNIRTIEGGDRVFPKPFDQDAVLDAAEQLGGHAA
jgi:CheY-like chemotaxis protein